MIKKKIVGYLNIIGLQRYRFWEEHPCINRQDYAMLVGKTKPQALQDIRAFLEEGILKKYGSGRSVVYIK